MFSIHCGRAARRRGRRPGFALRDLLACIVSLSMLGMLGCMCLNRTTGGNRRNGCLSNIRMLGLATFGHESTLKRFPVVSDAADPLRQVAPGTLTGEESTASGYSWVTKVLPYIEEDLLYDEIRRHSAKFQTPPFDPAVARDDGPHLATVVIPSLRCPSYNGDAVVAASLGSEYDDLALLGGAPAITSYMAIVGTHATVDGIVQENGVVVSRCEGSDECDNKGLKIGDLADGTAHTLLFCETREPVYAAWIDGQATWVVGVNPAGAGTVTDDGLPGATATMIEQSAYSAFALSSAWPGKVARKAIRRCCHPEAWPW